MAGDLVMICRDIAHANSSFSKRCEISQFWHLASCIVTHQLAAHLYHL